MKKLVAIILLFLLFGQCSLAQVQHISSFETKTLVGSAINHVNITRKYKWDVQVFYKNNTHKTIRAIKLDSLDFNDFDKVIMTLNFSVDSTMTDIIYGLKYNLVGSANIIINANSIVKTGSFTNDAKLSKQRIEGVTNFVLTNTLNSIEIIYLPHQSINAFNFDLSIGAAEWITKSDEAKHKSDNESFALAFFYLAFTITFLLFYIFSSKAIENLYFSLFCFFGAVSFLSSSSDFNFDSANFMMYSMFICIEFMTLFLAKVLVNSNRSKIPLCIIILLAIISNHPYFLYAFGTLQINSSSVFTGITYAVLILFTSVSALYYLVRGFGQKKWEAKTITIGCSIGFFVNIILISILAVAFGNSFATVLDKYPIIAYLPDFGLCIYPLTVAFVLAKRNGRNQKKLIDQVVSIKELSDLNLERETEKKKIVEEQNVFLEKKVAERTSELASKNELISYKNREITDSLIYAKRIQSAILPDIKLILKALEQSFILYAPKDIVSGDFYGFSQKNDKVIIAAADCTGHGVSGAFMSMIGSSLFNQIINERNITTPSLILNELNEGVIQSLKQRDSESHDGMDIALCSFDLRQQTLEFAGANRPLWIIRNNTIIIYPANKFPIGGLQILHDDNFTNHEIKLEANDTIYIFSDGFADQFGGQLGKKFMTKRFKNELLSIQHLNMQQQENHLKKLFEDWKGNNEQVDDVLVIGIRI